MKFDGLGSRLKGEPCALILTVTKEKNEAGICLAGKVTLGLGVLPTTFFFLFY